MSYRQWNENHSISPPNPPFVFEGEAPGSYKYKYNGMEFQEDLGLNMYDMPFRDYDPAIGRWVVVDPVTDFDRSPYNGMDNNPVMFADPSGASATILGNWENHHANKFGDIDGTYIPVEGTYEEGVHSGGGNLDAQANEFFAEYDAARNLAYFLQGIIVNGGANTGIIYDVDSGPEISEKFTQVLQSGFTFGCSWAVKISTDLFFGKSSQNENWLNSVKDHGAWIY